MYKGRSYLNMFLVMLKNMHGRNYYNYMDILHCCGRVRKHGRTTNKEKNSNKNYKGLGTTEKEKKQEDPQTGR